MNNIINDLNNKFIANYENIYWRHRKKQIQVGAIGETIIDTIDIQNIITFDTDFPLTLGFNYLIHNAEFGVSKIVVNRMKNNKNGNFPYSISASFSE